MVECVEDMSKQKVQVNHLLRKMKNGNIEKETEINKRTYVIIYDLRVFNNLYKLALGILLGLLHQSSFTQVQHHCFILSVPFRSRKKF